MSETVRTYRYSVDQYHRLAEAGILREDERVELLDGDLVVMSPIGKWHAQAVRNLIQVFQPPLLGRCIVDCQNPFVLNDSSQPQPDILLLRPEMQRRRELPRPADIFLLVEVAESSLGYDRGVKLQAYAESGVREVWILNLSGDVVECYREPQGRAYLRTNLVRRGDSIGIEALPGTSFAVTDLLP